MVKLDKLRERFGWFGFVRLLFYPLTVLLTTPVRLMQTLWSCRILVGGKWGDYNRFTPRNGINSLFYWTQALNLYRFGRSGNSPYLGLGNYPLSRGFQYTLVSLYSYRGASTITVLSGMFGWLLVHLFWINQINPAWVIIVTFLALISTSFYVNTFALQNYNALGWLFFPLGLYGIFTENCLIAGIAWFLVSFGSFTVVFLANIFCAVIAIKDWTIIPILAILPANLKLLMHFYPSLIQGKIKSIFWIRWKAVGMPINRNKKYRRFRVNDTEIVYFFLLYAQFLIATYLATSEIPVLFLSGIIIFLLNSTYLRFADKQSIQMLIFSLATVIMIQTQDILLLPSYWILISPLPRLAGFPNFRNVLDVVPRLRPFYIKKFINSMEQFLEPVRPGQRVLMAFNDPKGIHEKIFDGYRTLIELPHYVCSKQSIHFMPDWRGVFELNYEGAPDFWGRDVDSVIKNMKQWKADYVVVYQNTGRELESKWEGAGFGVLSKFSWADYEKEFKDKEPYAGRPPDWWLLKKL